MKIPFFDLRVLDLELREKLLGATARVFDHGRIIMGPEVEAFEDAVAKEVGVRQAVAVGSGSSALYLALRSAGIGPGDEVVTTPLTWIITANAIAATGATPVFADVREDCNLDPAAVEACINSRTRAIVPMHFGGHLCDMPALEAVAKRYGLAIFEDAAQAFGGSLGGRKAGSFSLASGISMNPMKILGAFGEAGVVVTNDDEIAGKVRQLRHAGTTPDPEGIAINICHAVALNHKPDTLQMALLSVMLRHLQARRQRRESIATKLTEGLADVVQCPHPEPGEVHARYMFTLRCSRRDKLRKRLADCGVETKVFYLPLASEAPLYQLKKHSESPVASMLVNQILVLPSHEKLTDTQVEYMIQTVCNFYQSDTNPPKLKSCH